MPISTTCPRCQAVYNLADHLEGHKVRCKKCQAIISVSNGAARSEENERITATATKRPKATPEREEERPASPRRKKPHEDERPPKRKSNMTLLIVGGVLAGVFLLCLGIGGALLYIFWPSGGGVGQAAKDMLVDVSGPWPQPMPLQGFGLRADQVVTVRVANCSNQFAADEVSDRLSALADKGGNFNGMNSARINDRMTVMLTPVRDVQAFANRIDFGTVRSVKDRTITMVARDFPDVPAPNADQVTIALYRLKLPRSNRHADAARSLKGLQPDAARREEVRKALEAVIDDPDQGTRNEICTALGVWGTKETVPVLVKKLKEPGTRRFAMQALAKIKDPSAVEAIAACLETPETRGDAAHDLKTIGPSAEPIVVKYLKNPDPRVKEQACHILEQIGSKQSISAVEELLNDPDASVKGTAKRTIEVLRNKRS